MLNNLFESLCVTSAFEIRSNLYLCSPPFIYINDQKYEFNAKTIYLLQDNVIVIFTIDNCIKFVNQDLELLSSYTLPQIPLAIYPYKDFIVLDYQYEYQICKIDEIDNLIKKNKIVSFAPNPTNQLTYVIKQKLMECNVVYSHKFMDIEMGVEQIYSISKTQPLFLYQSIVFPQLTIIDLNKCEELYHIEFGSQIEQIFLYQNSFLLQSENKLYQIQNQEVIEFNLNFQFRVSCVVEFNNQTFFGSINDNSILVKDNQIIKEFYNLGQIVDIHPCNQICFIASYNKKYPVSLFRKGINENVLERYKLTNEMRPRKIFFINSSLIMLTFSTSSEIYTIPQFIIADIKVIKNQKTLLIHQLSSMVLVQITVNKIIYLQSFENVIYQEEFIEKIKDCRIDLANNALYLYFSNNELRLYTINNSNISFQSSQIINHLSAFQIINKKLHYSVWFQFELNNFNDKQNYVINNISSTIVSIEQTQNFILLGLVDGNLVSLVSDTYRFHKIFQISNTHPIKLMKFNNRVIIFSHHIYMIDNQLQQIIVNWDHLYDISFQNDKLIGIVQNEIQIVTLSQGSSSQCRELKFIKNLEIKSLRFFKDHLIVLTTQNLLLSYFDDQLKTQSQQKFQIEKMEQYNNIYLVGFTESQQGKINILNEQLQLVYNYTFSEPIYDLKLSQKIIYFATETAIHTNDGQFVHNFNIPIKGFDIKDKYFLIYENFKGAHLFYYDEKMIALGSLNYPCQYASFYYEDIICFSENDVKIAKLNLLTFTISEQMEIAVSNPIEVTCVKDKYYGTLYGVLGYYE
ncbi:unnamed protein product [Paramecium sonneborni]|uniref:Uncharacterized protein n=1 Tax=Paramecium sonneborni TaxID=65129 RepID=A0A8S1MMG2_9CILI|nr:unnamed protein product [Paramecium sonneborni]